MESTIEKIVITLAKKDSYFLYFLLESHEGLCFYSTLEANSNAPGLARIELTFDSSTSEQVRHLLQATQSIGNIVFAT